MSQETAIRATVTIDELAETLGIARSTAYMLAREGRLPVPVIRLGRRLVVSRTAVESILRPEATLVGANDLGRVSE